MSKYLTTRALEQFDNVRNRFWNWLLDEARNYRRFAILGSFVLGAIAMRLLPEAFNYAAIVGGTIFIALFVASFLIPVAYFIEWAIRRYAAK